MFPVTRNTLLLVFRGMAIFEFMFPANIFTSYRVAAFFTAVILIACFISCQLKKEKRQVDRGFYYWKSVLRLSGFEKQQLDSLHVQTLYIRFFDVDWDETTRSPIPLAKLQGNGYRLPAGLSVIPTIFITNECMQKTDSLQVSLLADKIYSLMQEIIHNNGFNSIKEIQFDCDWTASTRPMYFLLLEKTKALWKDASITLSATIRLHQVKFITKTGTPPADRGLLMCYNMGNLKNPATRNSILETTELKKYINHLSSYPLPLDVAFPLFSWKVVFRNNEYAGIIQQLPDSAFSPAFVTANGNRYTITKDTVLQGYELRKGDVIRNEQSTIKELSAAATEVTRYLKNTSLRVSLYHLDSVILNKYSIHELEGIYNSLR